MITQIISSEERFFDLIISPPGTNGAHVDDLMRIEPLSEVTHFASRISQRLGMNRIAGSLRFGSYLSHIHNLLSQSERLVLNIVDNYKLLDAVHCFIEKKKIRERVVVNFFQHGYDYGFDQERRLKFYNSIDNLILLTESSLQFQKNSVPSVSCNMWVLPNGVEETQFFRVNLSRKQELREQLGWDGKKKYFLWVSLDRPKKGLEVIEKAWEKFAGERDDVELVIIGTKDLRRDENSVRLGQMSNQDIAKYYQAADFYLFSTQCNEGHPLTLTEALRCGTTCIASDIEPISEILADGRYGRLVSASDQPEVWANAMSEELERYEANGNTNPYLSNVPEDIYTFSEWKESLKEILDFTAKALKG